MPPSKCWKITGNLIWRSSKRTDQSPSEVTARPLILIFKANVQIQPKFVVVK
jgi:hypothetical protein